MRDFHLERFTEAQNHAYPRALEEIRRGQKVTDWIWYIFPQLSQLGYSFHAKYYGISGREEARAYLADPNLSGNLIEISEALLSLPTDNPRQVLGSVDSLKVRSCMTLFEAVSEEGSVFTDVLEKFYGGRRDELTLHILGD